MSELSLVVYVHMSKWVTCSCIPTVLLGEI